MSGSDDGLDRVLSGEASSAAGVDPLGPFVQDLKLAFPPAPVMAQEAHLEAVVHAAREAAAAAQPLSRKERRVRVPRFRSLTAKLVAGGVVLFTSFGGLAVAGALPGGLQNGVANAAAGIGVNLPGGDDDAVEPVEVEDETEAVETEAPEPAETEAPEAEETEEPDAEETEAPEADDQGEDEQSGDQGEDEQSGDQGEDEQSGDQGEDEQSGDQGED